MTEDMKTTAPYSSVSADEGQPFIKKSIKSIANNSMENKNYFCKGAY